MAFQVWIFVQGEYRCEPDRNCETDAVVGKWELENGNWGLGISTIQIFNYSTNNLSTSEAWSTIFPFPFVNYSRCYGIPDNVRSGAAHVQQPVDGKYQCKIVERDIKVDKHS